MKIDSNNRSRGQLKRQLVAYSFIAPNFFGFAFFTLIPMVFSLVLAFMKWNGAGGIENMHFVGLANFARFFKDPSFGRAVRNTFVYTFSTVPFTLIFALGLAILLNSKIKGRNFFRTISFFPYVASLVAVATVWRFMFSPTVGPINMALSSLLHVSVRELPRWPTDSFWAMFFVVFFSVWKNMGYYMVIYLAGLQGVNTELYEAASIDGANKWSKFWNVTRPQISHTTFFIVMMLMINSFKAYDIFFTLFAGGDGQLGDSTRVIVYQIWNTAFRYLDYGYASAMALVLFIIVLSVTLLQFQGEKKYGE